MGWLPEEFELGGVPFKDRGKRADEMLVIMKDLWEGKFVEFEGHTIHLNPCNHFRCLLTLVSQY